MKIVGMKSRNECDAAADTMRQANSADALSGAVPNACAAPSASGSRAPSMETRRRHSVLTWMPGAAPVRHPMAAPAREK